MKLDQIEELMRLMKANDLGELEVKLGDLEFKARRGARNEQTFVMQSAPGLIQPVPAAEAASPRANTPAVGTEPVSAAPVATAAPAAPAAKEEQRPPDNLKEICSPLVGTFYRAPSPDAPPYVETGDIVEHDTVACIVEAMKVMNEIKAEMKGRVRKVLVENATPVEYGQPLFLIEPL